ncbi:unnamed protein product [Hymenolepis diminuta]|uniref:BTB domain-containing protein n=1 Tax=Hymenolepis diminuta TaxID=6216 RepID=A0A564YD36_HYMDI|nr:unnamed protein product [Hymenolepis diminuta]
MRVRRERLINSKKGEEVGAHLIVLSASFPVFRKHLSGNDVVHVQLSRYPMRVVNAAVEYAYGDIENISPDAALRLYLLAHNLQNKALVVGCTKFLCGRIEEINVSEVWSAANATKNEVLIVVCAPLVAKNWEMFRTSRLFHMNTEIKDMMSLLGCPRMARESVKSKVTALLEWRNALRDDEVRTARNIAFRDIVSLLKIQYTPDFITDLFVEGIDIPVEWSRCPAERLKPGKKQPIASSSMTSNVKFCLSLFVLRNQEILATFEYEANAKRVCILNAECTEVEIERQLALRGYTNIFTFQNKLAFIGDYLSENKPGSRRVDLMDVSTGQLLSLPDMMNAICSPVCVGIKNEIVLSLPLALRCFRTVFRMKFSRLLQEGGRLFQPCRKKEEGCALLSTMQAPPYWSLVELEENMFALHHTELLPRRPSEGGGKGGEKWQWRHFPPMHYD